jgi:hypothetical protein
MIVTEARSQKGFLTFVRIQKTTLGIGGVLLASGFFCPAAVCGVRPLIEIV